MALFILITARKLHDWRTAIQQEQKEYLNQSPSAALLAVVALASAVLVLTLLSSAGD